MKVTLLDSSNCVLLLIDFQSQMLFGVGSVDGVTLINNVVGLAKAAKIFNVPTVMTTIAEKGFSGPVFEQLQAVVPERPYIDRTTMNSWEDTRVVDAVVKTKRKKVVMAGLWTEVCIAFPAISALADGYEVYVVVDACGGTTSVSHNSAIQRIIQAGGTPVTWIQFLCELQRDWARQETYDAVMQLANDHAGNYGVGIQYYKAEFAQKK